MNRRQGWCSIRLRVSQEELSALRGAETFHGHELSLSPSAEALREALALMRAGRKLAAVAPRAPLSLSEPEALGLVAAARVTQRALYAFRDQAVGWSRERTLSAEQEAALKQAFPQIVHSAWAAYQIGRVLEAVADRIEVPFDPSLDKSGGRQPRAGGPPNPVRGYGRLAR